METVSHIESLDDYVKIHAAGKKYLEQRRLAKIKALLDLHRFARIHRSTIVNEARVARIELCAKRQPRCNPEGWEKTPDQPHTL